MTPYFIGVAIALVTCAYGAILGLEKERAFYPTVLVATSTYYVLFAAIGGAGWVPESVIMIAFVILASMGFKRSAWIVVFGLVGHAVLDSVHGRVVQNAGVPASWPSFCLAFDLAAAAYLALILLRAPGLRAHRQPAEAGGSILLRESWRDEPRG